MTRVLTAGVRRSAAALAALVLAGGLAVAAPTTAGAAPAPDDEVRLTALTTNGRVDPLGIPGAAPSFGWQARSSARAVVQSAYQVRVATSEASLGDDDVWDSGRVESARQVDVGYGGPALSSQTRYVWQVRTWDGDGAESAWSEPASFETGLLDASDWGDAAWVGGAPGTELDRWTDYTATFDFRIDNLVFGSFVRAADTNNAYMWQLSVADGTPRFRPHKRVNGAYTLLANQDISATVSAAQLRSGWHTMAVTFDGATITTTLDGTVIDTRTDASLSRGFVGFRTDQANEGPERQTVRDVRVVAESGDVLLDTDFASGDNPFSGGSLTPDGLFVDARQDILWRSPDANLPLLRTDFTTDETRTVERARVYATARGVYELTINGEQVGDQHLAPGWTDYQKRFQHQTYDVTDLVDGGANTLGAQLADGWWGGKVGMWGPGVYGNDLSLLARLRVDYTDGTSAWVDSDDSWTSHTGPYTFTDNIDGESYDARQEQAGWDRPGFDDAGWRPVVVRPAPGAVVVPQPDDPVRTTEELAVVERTEPKPGAFVYDLGQNMVGVARMRLQGRAGRTVTIRYGEELNPDGTLYTANLRAAKVTDRYTFAETGVVTYEPTFTQHGFRYVEIVGATSPPATTDVTGVVWGSDLRATGDLDTSSDMLDQLVSNISWGQRGNFLSIPTDTPARDERLGWTGDINVFAPTASYLRDTRAFLSKWMVDLRDSAYADGNFPGVAPQPKGIDLGHGLGWSDAAITVPYAVWHAHDDAAIVRENYAAMRKFMELVRDKAGDDLIDSARGNWDDWLNLDDPTPTSVLGTAYLAEDARMMSKMAAAVGEDADAQAYADLSTAVREAFTAELVAENGVVQGGSQTAYAMALGMGLVSDPELRDKVAARFVAKLAAGDNHLTTGFLGTPWLLPALSAIDRDDLAYTMLLHEDYPSWGYEVVNGATTMWERWNSIMPDGTFGPVEMNSFNHYAYGAVGDWMYQHIGGIRAVEPGYRVSRIEPSVGGGLTHGAGDLQTVYGPIATDWALDGADLALAVEVPVNTTSQVVLPADNAAMVTEGGSLLGDVEGVTDVSDDGDTVTVTVGSGSYDFAVTAGNAVLGAVLDDLDALQQHVAGLADAGDLEAGDRAQLDAAVEGVREHVGAALLAAVEGDGAALTSSLQSALAGTRALGAWIDASELDDQVRAGLADRVGAIEAQLVTAVTRSLGVTVSLPPVSGPVLPGAAVSGTVEVANVGTSAATLSAGTLVVDGLGSATLAPTTVPAGGTVQVPVSLVAGRHQDAGPYAADLTLELAVGGASYPVSVRTEAWVTVTSGLTVGAPTAVLDGGDPSEHATVSVPVTNTGTAAVRAHVALVPPADWRTVPSGDVLVPAGAEVAVEVPVVLPLDLVGGPVPVTVEVRRGASVLTAVERAVSVAPLRPPSATAVDHVDFGDAGSETAHALQASPSSGTNVEAGLTRRYANSASPGAWYSVQVDVPAGQAFVLRAVETFDGPRTKKYHVYVDDVRVRTQLVPRAETGAGSTVYDALVDRPDLTGDGSVRVRFEYPVDAAGFFDPSLADLWVLPVPADTQAPDVAAVVTGGTVGDAGWYRSDVTLEIAAVDNRDPEPAVRSGADQAPYAGPVTVGGEGEHDVTYRATDDAGNTSGPRTATVAIDTVAPRTTLTATRGAGVEGADSVSLAFAASDATSGVAATLVRVDGGPWASAGAAPVVVTGFGAHTVEFASTDVAGNAEPLRAETVLLADVDTVGAITSPQVTGAAAVGATLTATTGSWNTKGLSFAHQWLRDGQPVPGATAPTYRVGVADVGARVSVRVTATKAGKAPGVATSAATAVVAKVGTRTKVTAPARARAGRTVKVTAVVTGTPRATGTVAVRIDGRVVARVALRNGRAVAQVRIAKPGKHRVAASYGGSGVHAASTSRTRTITVRPR